MRNSKKKLTKKEQELVDNSEWQVSPFEAKGAAEGELDQDYSVTPNKEWESMKKYNNFISEWLCVSAVVKAGTDLNSSSG